jgi:monoterpene epsilon-lactone hydrolase
MKIRVLSLLAAIAFVQNLTAQSNPVTPKDSATFDPDGTAHITRVVPMPLTISTEAQKWLASLNEKKSGPESLAERRTRTDIWRAQDSAEARKLYPVNVEETSIGGVRTDIITPLSTPEANRSRVLINLHGRGFNSDSGSLIEGVPISNLAEIKVVSFGLLSARSGKSLPSRRRRRCGRLQRTPQNLQAAQYRNFWHFGGSHPEL